MSAASSTIDLTVMLNSLGAIKGLKKIETRVTEHVENIFFTCFSLVKAVLLRRRKKSWFLQPSQHAELPNHLRKHARVFFCAHSISLRDLNKKEIYFNCYYTQSISNILLNF